MEKSIFLYFLDSELQHTLSRLMTENEIEEYIWISVLCQKNVYVSYSHVLTLPYRRIVSLLQTLNSKGFISFFLAGKDKDSFLEQHHNRYKYYENKEIYPYESSRYSCFINRDSRPYVPLNCINKKGSATKFIKAQLENMINYCCEYKNLEAVYNENILSVIREYFPNNEKALTIAAFRPYFFEKYDFREANKCVLQLQQALAFFHNKSLILEKNSSILHFIPQCEIYDYLDSSSVYDVKLLRAMFEPLISNSSETDLFNKLENLHQKKDVNQYYNTVDEILLFYAENNSFVRKTLKKYIADLGDDIYNISLFEYIDCFAHLLKMIVVNS